VTVNVSTPLSEQVGVAVAAAGDAVTTVIAAVVVPANSTPAATEANARRAWPDVPILVPPCRRLSCRGCQQTVLSTNNLAND
jgi:hypothetical protein